MNISVAVDQAWGIGRKNRLLVRLPADMKNFVKLTTGKVVVMGRRTWESIPNPPLKDRVNIVLSADPAFAPGGAVLCRSAEAALGELAAYPPEDIFIIGGESVYRLLLPYCRRAYVTRFSNPNGLEADRFFPNLEEMPQWHIAEESEEKESNGISFRFAVFERDGADS